MCTGYFTIQQQIFIINLGRQCCKSRIERVKEIHHSGTLFCVQIFSWIILLLIYYQWFVRILFYWQCCMEHLSFKMNNSDIFVISFHLFKLKKKLFIYVLLYIMYRYVYIMYNTFSHLFYAVCELLKWNKNF